MKVEFSNDDTVTIVPETSVEAYALTSLFKIHGLSRVWASREGENIRIRTYPGELNEANSNSNKDG